MTQTKLERLLATLAEKLTDINRKSPLPEEMNGCLKLNLNNGRLAGKASITVEWND